MIDTDAYYRALGATQALDPDQQLVLEGQVRVVCTAQDWTAIFEALLPSTDKLDAMFEVCRNSGGLLPFTTRSGQLGVRGPCAGAGDETADALQRLRAVMRQLEQGPAG